MIEERRYRGAPKPFVFIDFAAHRLQDTETLYVESLSAIQTAPVMRGYIQQLTSVVSQIFGINKEINKAKYL
jgi:hypothetical protein